MRRRYCKLTDAKDRTRNDCQWGPGITHTADGEGGLCTGHWIHGYAHPLVAVMLNPTHGEFDLPTAHLWSIRVEGKRLDGYGLKFGATTITTVKRIPLPVVSREAKIAFGILCALEVCQAEWFVTWATNWLSGKDRSTAVALAVANAAYAAAYVATCAEYAATYAAQHAAYAATYVVDATCASYVATCAEYAATYAASRALVKPLDLIALAAKAVAMFPVQAQIKEA